MATYSSYCSADGEPLWVPRPAHLVDLLRCRAAARPDERAYTFLVDGEDEEDFLSCAQLERRAIAIAVALQRRGMVGQPALLVYEPGLDYIAAFFGCLYAGVIAVPICPPDPVRFHSTFPRLQSVILDAGAKVVLSTSELLSWSDSWFDRVPCLESLIATDELSTDQDEDDWAQPDIDAQTVAFLQYTSGSTGSPKGVVLTHGNLMHNLAAIHRLDGENCAGVSWLPPYHDMGLIGGMLWPLYSGARMYLMSPLAFVQRPIRWLRAMSKYRGVTSGAPNFGYDLCVRKITPEQCTDLDLSRWAVATNGAEPVRHDTLERFVEAFEPYGFSPKAFYPCYGLAEATVLVSGGRREQAPVVRTFQAGPLEQGCALPSTDGSPSRSLVSCGQSIEDQQLLIVDPAACVELPEGRVGEIWISGPSVASGYWNKPLENKRTFDAHLADSGEGPYLRTGDLGFMDGGELFVTGRLKDLIIIWGCNYYPQDIEHTVERTHPALKRDGGAAFSIDIEDEERLVVVHEVLRPKKVDLEELLRDIRQNVFKEHGLPVHAVVLIQAGSIPKTSSGKIQRHTCRELFLSDDLLVLAQWREDAASTTVPGAEYVVPGRGTEGLLAGLWCDVLGLDRVGRHDNFFCLGGHSLLATQLISRVQSQWDIALPLTVLFAAPTLAELAQSIDAMLREGTQPRLPPLKKVDRDRPLALSSAQQRLWFLDQMEPGNPFYNLPTAALLTGPLQTAALEHSLNEVLRRHESLRTTFANHGGTPLQSIMPAEPVDLVQVDLRDVARSDRQAELARRMRIEARRPFDLTRGPLFRATLFRLDDEQHVLLLAMHHIVADGWSLGVLVRELIALYEACCEDRQPTLAAPPIQYADFAAWQQETLQGDLLGEQLDYWRQALSNQPDVLDLPADHPRPAEPTFAGALESRQLPATLTEKLQSASQAEGVTPFMTLLAAFQSLLLRYTGQDDISVGSPIANRTHLESENLVGFLANTLVLRTDLSGDPTFRELLSRVKQTTLGAYAHQDVPFEKLVEALQPARSVHRTPLFQVAMVLENAPLPLDASATLQVTPLEVDNGTSKYDLTLICWQRNGRLVFSAEYSTELFEAATIQRLLGSLEQLLGAALADPGRKLSELPILSDSQRRLLLSEFNATLAPYPMGRCLHQLVALQSARTPDSPAVSDDRQTLTYAELDRRANQLARYLKDLRVGPDVLVGLCLTRGVSMVVGLLGILKAGGAYVPLDPAYPSQRLAFMLEDSRARVLLTESQLQSQLPKHDAEEVLLDAHWRDIARYSDRPLECEATPKDLAYVIYTSGSTGKPKGVEISHAALVNFLWSMRREPGLSGDDVLVAVTTLSFDIAALEIFLPLVSGAKVVVADREVAADGFRLAALLANSGATVLQATPVTWRMLLEADWSAEPNFKILCGGEALGPQLASRLMESGARLWNLYGPTETTIWSTVYQVASPQQLAPGSFVPIGRPIANTQIYLLDAQQNPTPLGVPGELYIGGDGLARGYRGCDELTRQRFVRNPFRDEPGSRLYRTGDLARYLPDGTLEFLGRMDQQIKIRGYRVELGEIETVLARHPALRENAVVLRGKTPEEARLVAYYVARNGSPPDGTELRQFLQQQLPDYMIPLDYVCIDALPTTPNGKLDRRALPMPEPSRGDSITTFVAPRQGTEELLARLFAQLLGVDRVGRYDNFFELGGHSLLATQLMSRLRDELAVELPLKVLFERPTVESLAELVTLRQIEQRDPAHMAHLLEQLEEMTDDEARKNFNPSENGK